MAAKEITMFEATTNPAARNAIGTAHIARGQFIQDAMAWIFGAKSAR